MEPDREAKLLSLLREEITPAKPEICLSCGRIVENIGQQHYCDEYTVPFWQDLSGERETVHKRARSYTTE